ncbi:MAG: glycosyltransferase [Opitutae bacterium]|nr:glycosyltransferase [Opitutae bacterium]
MSQVHFSIITPTLNCAATLPATLLAVQQLRTAISLEHFVVDSDSTDGTAQLAERSGAVVLRHPRGNMYAAINAGVKAAQGAWVTYLNGDDVLYADAIVAALQKHGTAAEIIYGDIDYIDETGRFLFSWRAPEAGWLGFLKRYYNPFPQQGTLFRRELFDRLGGFDTHFRYSADYDFWCRAEDAGARFQKHAGPSHAGFRLLPSQLSQSRRHEMAPEGQAIRARLRQGRGALAHAAGNPIASLYRWSTNLDSYWLRRTRGRELDRRG